MNFCGSSNNVDPMVDHQQVVVLSRSEIESRMVDPHHLCCVVPEQEGLLVQEATSRGPAPSTREIIKSAGTGTSTSTATTRKTKSRMSSVWSGAEDEDDLDDESSRPPLTLALDVIQHTLHDRKKEFIPEHIKASPIPEKKKDTMQVIKTPPMSHRRVITTHDGNDIIMGGGTPSPRLLNPLSTKLWTDDNSNDFVGDGTRLETRRRRFGPLSSVTRPANTNSKGKPSTTTRRTALNSKLFCPGLAHTQTLESLMKRLQAGFNVHLLQDDKLGPVFLYLHFDRSKLCIIRGNGNDYDGAEEKKVIDEWIELPMSKVLRLEVGKASHPLASKYKNHGHQLMTFFSIIVNQDSNIIYYDFEADSPLDREVLVSTLIVVLDQAQESTLEMRPEPPSEDPYALIKEGTLDEPIPCSPSLELPDYQLAPTLSPRKRTHIYDDGNDGSTEMSLAATEVSSSSGVIHLEHLDSSALMLPTVDESQVSDCIVILQEPSLSYKSEISDDVVHTFSTEGVVVTNTIDIDFEASAQQLSGGWGCADSDICTLAISDLAVTCSGIFSKKARSSESEQRAMIEEYIACALGSPSAMYSYMFLTDGDVWNKESVPAKDGSDERADSSNNSRVRNRASLLNAQATRLKTLRNEMTFASALKQSRERMHFVQTTQSFDDSTRSGNTRKFKAAIEVANRFHTSALLQHLVGNMLIAEPGGNEEEPEQDVAYYDSDPEDARPQTLKKGPRRVTADRLNKVDSDIDASLRHEALDDVGFERIGSSRKVSKKLDEEVIVEIVQAMNNERLTLMWHPTQTKDTPNRSPVCVKLWIEAGVYLVDGSFLLPKLTWVKASDFDSKRAAPQALDLLDICRIRPTDKIDRKCHPFADASKSFGIETQTELFLFAAQSTQERDRIIYALKLVIARLASLLMLRDIRAAEEFFGAIVNNVPGEAPAIITGKDE